MFEFLSENWRIIVVVLCCVVEVLAFLILKKRPQILDNSLTIKLVQWIIQAEEKYKEGSDKMDFVLSEAERYLGEAFNRNEIRLLVEYLLTVPEKKKVR